jgi:hypothetical protein
VRRVSRQSSSSKAVHFREWRVTLLRYRGEFLGYVKATRRESAESEAARLFSLTEFQRRALLLQERPRWNQLSPGDQMTRGNNPLQRIGPYRNE